VVVLDVFSRIPLAAKVFWKDPSAPQMGRLVQRAARRFTPPRHFVSDKGSQFTAKRFRMALRRLGTRQRFGAVGRYGSIAIIERLWRTLKDGLRLRSFKPLTKRELQRRLELGLYYYTYLRPHQGLGGATPAEIHFGRERAHLAAVHPPRARPREGPADSPFEIAFLDPEKMLPVLIESRLVSPPSKDENPTVVIYPEPRSRPPRLSKRSSRTAFYRCLDRKNNSDPPRQLPLHPCSLPESGTTNEAPSIVTI